MKDICKNCKYWKNNQSELEYSENSGICVSPKLKFSTTNYKSAYLLDRENKTNKYKGVSIFENVSDVVPFGKVEESRYCLITDDSFGCINFINK